MTTHEQAPGRAPIGSGRPRGRIEVPADPRDLPGTFGHRREMEVRFGDTDAMGHVNNAVYLTYIETARVAWWSEVTGEPIVREPGRAESLILAEADIAFRAPIFHGEMVVVETRATGVGRTSLRVEHRLTAGRPDEASRLVATCRTVIVRYDYDAERPVPFALDTIERIERAEGMSLRD
jgi:acyl-CoA thioester hydrolase